MRTYWGMSVMSCPSPTIAAWWHTASTPRSADSHRAAIGDVGLDHLDVRIEIVRALWMDARIERVEHAHVVVRAEQKVDDV